MAETPSNGNFANYGIIFATLLSAIAVLFPGAPTLNTRPLNAATKVYETASAQDVDMRLWQDPFGIVDRATKPGSGAVSCRDDVGAPRDRHCETPSWQLAAAGDLEKGSKPIHIGVSLSGAPYPEVAESRRQARYAVVSGLSAQGYVPQNPQGMGYYRPPPSTDASASASPLPIIPYELFVPSSAAAGKEKVILLWLNEDMYAGRPLQYFCRLLNKLDLEKAGMQVLGPRASGTLRDFVREVKSQNKEARDLFKNCRQGVEQSRFYAYSATVDDRALMTEFGRPDVSVRDFFAENHINIFRTVATDDILAKSIVHEMERRNVKPGLARHREPKVHPDKNVYSYEQHIVLISEWDTFYGQSFPKTLTNKFFKLQKAQQKSKQGEDPPWVHPFTYLRGLDGGLPRDQVKEQAAGEARPEANKDQSSNKASNTKTSELPFGNGQFDYLQRMAARIRALDDDLHSKGGAIKAVGVIGADVFDKLQVLRALKFELPEAIYFTTDFDDNFTRDDDRNWARNLIIASSFGPELAQPLQHGIPPFRENYQTAAFLSIQLAVIDARVPQGSTSLVSVFGALLQVAVDDWAGQLTVIDAQVPQGVKSLASWLSAPLLVLTGDWAAAARYMDDMLIQRQLKHWLKTPPIFEIGRSGHVLQLPQSQLGIGGASEHDFCSDIKSLHSCKKILPNAQHLYSEINPYVRPIAAILLVIVMIYPFIKGLRHLRILETLSKDSHRHQRRRYPTFADFTCWAYKLVFVFFSCLGGAFLLILVLAWPQFADLVTGHGLGEPMLLFEGVSLWPSIALRLVTLIVSLAFIFLAWAQLDSNLNSLARSMGMTGTARAAERTLENNVRIIIRIIFMKLKIAARRTKMMLMNREFGNKILYMNFNFIFNNYTKRERINRKKILNVNEYWSVYIYRCCNFSRMVRVSVCASFMIFAYSLLFLSMRSPVTSGRSIYVVKLYSALTTVDVVLMFFLIALVADATLSNFLFVRQLAKGRTLWPETTHRIFIAKLGLEHSRLENKYSVLDDWIDLSFISKRTECINRLIYYPFAIIALMIVSRSAVFGDFPLSKPILITQGLSLAIVAGCAIALNRMAEEARSLTQRHLMEEIVKSKASPKSPLSGQWASLLDRVNALREGAFRPFLQQPLFGAVLLPLSGVGWSTLLEKGILGQ